MNAPSAVPISGSTTMRRSTKREKRDRQEADIRDRDASSRGGGGDDSSGSSSALDSMRPVVPAPRKRRRTFLDAFNSITIRKPGTGGTGGGGTTSGDDGDGEDADSSQAVADETAAGENDGCGSSTSSLEEDGLYGIDDKLLSDREEAERKVMLELVLGSEMVGTKDVVDIRIERMIRDTIKQVQANTTTKRAADDMTIEPSYSRPSTSMHNSFSNNAVAMSSSAAAAAAGGGGGGGGGGDGMEISTDGPQRQRSNSLPDNFVSKTTTESDAAMAMDAEHTADHTNQASLAVLAPPISTTDPSGSIAVSVSLPLQATQTAAVAASAPLNSMQPPPPQIPKSHQQHLPP